MAGGDDGELLWMQERLFQLWQCVRDQTEQVVVFSFFFFFFHFLPCFELTWAIFFFVFFYVYKFWDSRYRKKKEERGIFS